MTTAEQLAHAINGHVIRKVARANNVAFAWVVDSSGASPPTVSITLRGSSVQIDGVRYLDNFNPVAYTTFPLVLVAVTPDGDYCVIGALA